MKEGNQRSNDKQDEASGYLQSRLREIASWSLENNADEADANELEKLEKLLSNALRDTKSKKSERDVRSQSTRQDILARRSARLSDAIKSPWYANFYFATMMRCRCWRTRTVEGRVRAARYAMKMEGRNKEWLD